MGLLKSKMENKDLSDLGNTWLQKRIDMSEKNTVLY